MPPLELSSPPLTPHRRTDWAEEEDDDSLALPQPTVTKNKDGSETIVTYTLREDGKKIKTTRRIKKTTIKTTVNPRVAERKQWAKFGQEKGKPPGPQTDTTSVAENILFRPVAGWKASTEDKSEDAKKKANLKDAKIKCRICSGDHWTTKCPFKDTMAPEGADAPADMAEVAGGGAEAGSLGQGGSSYVPPHLRGRGGAGEKMGGKFERDDLATLRVTNVSEIAEEQDLRDMFSRFGHVTRVFLAKDRETGRAKGFAFVSFADRADAAKACEKMDGCEYLHILVKRSAWDANGVRRRLRTSHPARRVRQEGDIDGHRSERQRRRSKSVMMICNRVRRGVLYPGLPNGPAPSRRSIFTISLDLFDRIGSHQSKRAGQFPLTHSVVTRPGQDAPSSMEKEWGGWVRGVAGCFNCFLQKGRRGFNL